MRLDRTVCEDWREALDNAEFWDHACKVRACGGGAFIVEHFDNPHALHVDEIGHVEGVPCAE